MTAVKSPSRIPRMTIAATALILFGSTTPSSATMTEVMCGPGGKAFKLSCGSGSYVVGFHGRAGNSLDAIGLVCAPADRATGKSTGQRTRVGSAGGHGGSEQEVYCGGNDYLTAVGLGHTRGDGKERQFVNNVDVFCNHRPQADTCISSGEGCGHIKSKTVGTIVLKGVDCKYDRPSCPAGEYAVGIQGRSGNFVDAIGLICAAKPAAFTAGPPKVVEPGIDRPGGDYQNFDLANASPDKCRTSCQMNGKCLAYTYVKPGVQGVKARCWLKTSIPAARPNDCCVSEVVREADRPGQLRWLRACQVSQRFDRHSARLQSGSEVRPRGSRLLGQCKHQEW